MKNVKDICLITALLLVTTFSACKKGGESAPDKEEAQFTNSAQLFFSDNTSLQLEGNESVKATYAGGTLNVSFTKDGTEMAISIPNYNLATSSGQYNNGSAAVSLKKGQTYNSAYINIPVVVGFPPFPAFVQGKVITIKTNNLKVDGSTTDIAIGIQNGSELITVPAPGGNTPIYQSIGFVQGDGGKPNMINVRIKQ